MGIDMIHNSQSNCAIILAAGEGKRMKSNHPKVLSPVLFKPMVHWVVDAVLDAGITNICAVTGFKHEEVDAYLSENVASGSEQIVVETVLQEERKGTAHAVMMAESFLQRYQGGNVLILSGDAPFITPGVIQAALNLHIAHHNSATVISAVLDNPFGYGRIVRDPISGLLDSIVEEKDASPAAREICEVNSGAYWFSVDDLLSVLHKITNDNAQGEYYLPDAIKLLLESKKRVNACKTNNSLTVLGANDCMQLNELNEIARKTILTDLMKNGTSVPCTDGVIIGPDVTIGEHVTIMPSTVLKGSTVIGSDCTIGPNVLLGNVSVAGQLSISFLKAENVEISSTPAPFSDLH